MTYPPVSDNDLHAYVDGQLDPARRAEVENYLVTNPEAARRVAEYRALNESLRALHATALTEPVPGPLRVRRFRRMPLSLAASFAAMLVLGGVTGWQLHAWRGGDPAPMATIVQQASYAHVVYTPEVRHPVDVDGRDEAHLVQWLSKRLGYPLRAPHLAARGFELVGGRLLPAQGDAAAMFMYQDASGTRLTLYVRADGDADVTAFRYARQDRLHVFYWTDGSLGYALSGEIDKETLLAVATAVYEQLEQ